MKTLFEQASANIKGINYTIQWGMNTNGRSCVRIENGEAHTIHRNGDTIKKLRWINTTAKLNVQVTDSSGGSKNTHQLDKDIIRAMKPATK